MPGKISRCLIVDPLLLPGWLVWPSRETWLSAWDLVLPAHAASHRVAGRAPVYWAHISAARQPRRQRDPLTVNSPCGRTGAGQGAKVRCWVEGGPGQPGLARAQVWHYTAGHTWR